MMQASRPYAVTYMAAFIWCVSCPCTENAHSLHSMAYDWCAVVVLLKMN